MMGLTKIYGFKVIQITLIVFLLLLSLNTAAVRAGEGNHPEVRIDRTVRVEDGGALIINDTIILSPSSYGETGSISELVVGFPYNYKGNLTYISAVDQYTNPLDIVMDVDMGRTGFYGFKVVLPQPVDLEASGRYRITITCVFSGLVESEPPPKTATFHASFPLHPSLTFEAKSCNVTIILPSGASYSIGSLNFTKEKVDDRDVLRHSMSPLDSYAKTTAWIRFTSASFTIFEVEVVDREIKVEEWGSLTVTEFYQIINHANKLPWEISIWVPQNATEISASDPYGPLQVNVEDKAGYKEVDVRRRAGISGNRIKLNLRYRLPYKGIVAQNGWGSYNLKIAFPPREGWIIERLNVTIILPEGAKTQTSSGNLTLSHLRRNVLQEVITFTGLNVTSLHHVGVNLVYNYDILWVSFRPTLWSMTVMGVVCMILYLRGAPKPEVAAAPPPASLEILGRFIDRYEERMRIISELDSMERQVYRGKLSRRKYRLRRNALDGRLSRLQREINKLREEISKLDRRYADRMRQLEIAEADLETTKMNIDRLRARYRRGEISREAYRRLLDEYNRRRERAENTIEEVILRIKEQMA